MAADVKRKLEGKYLTFVLGDEEYGIDALKVGGILSLQPITPIPQAPHYFKGVITVRGKVAPVISARLKLGMYEIEDTPETCIILVTLKNAWAGIIVDTVRDVIDIKAEDIEKPPTMGGFDEREVIGLAKSGDKVKILLDIDETLSEISNYAQGFDVEEDAG